MSQGFDVEFRELVRSNTNLVDLVSESVALKPQRGGADYVGLCPFHDDRNPSFHVYPDRQTFRCWVCDKGGDCFRWVMDQERLSFPEAIERLAQRANLELPKQRRVDPALQMKQADTAAVLEWAVQLMHSALQTGQAAEGARRYVQERVLTAETVRDFQLGYHPENWNWFLERAHGRFTARQLLEAGLIGEQSSGQGYYDNLVGRLVFPIFDERGRPVAFGGRVLPGSNSESRAKYWNSNESAFFHKRKMLYAFDRARTEIVRRQTAIVVEGYMDTIACHQAGVTNVVATLGTALTDDHVRFLKRFARQVVLTYDGDEAGRRATERSIAQFLANDLDLRILILPDGLDPADYLNQYSAEEFRERLQTAPEAWEYKLQTLLERHDIRMVSGRHDVLVEMVEFLTTGNGLTGTIREDLILRSLCGRIQLDERRARQLLLEHRDRKVPSRSIRREDAAVPVSAEPPVVNSGFRAERELLEIMLMFPACVDVVRHHVGPDDFENAQHRRLLELCVDLRTEEGLLPEIRCVIAAADSDSDLLSLINAVIDSAQEKGLDSLMSAQPGISESGESTQVPPHLERVIGTFQRRRDQQRLLLSKQRMAQTTSSVSEPNDEQKDALRQLFRIRTNQMGQQRDLK